MAMLANRSGVPYCPLVTGHISYIKLQSNWHLTKTFGEHVFVWICFRQANKSKAEGVKYSNVEFHL